MTISLVGLPDKNHSTAESMQLWLDGELRSSGQDQYQLPLYDPSKPSLYPNTNLDDAVIHFQCGDVMSEGHSLYGFVKFGVYSRLISPDVKSI